MWFFNGLEIHSRATIVVFVYNGVFSLYNLSGQRVKIKYVKLAVNQDCKPVSIVFFDFTMLYAIKFSINYIVYNSKGRQVIFSM